MQLYRSRLLGNRGRIPFHLRDGGKLNVEADAVSVAGVDATAFQPAATGTPDGTKFLRDDNSWQALPGTAAIAYVNQNLGSSPRSSGSFTMTVASSTVGSHVEMFEVAETLASGELADRIEADFIKAVGIVTASTTATVYWSAAPGMVSGIRRFAYRITAP